MTTSQQSVEEPPSTLSAPNTAQPPSTLSAPNTPQQPSNFSAPTTAQPPSTLSAPNTPQPPNSVSVPNTPQQPRSSPAPTTSQQPRTSPWPPSSTRTPSIPQLSRTTPRSSYSLLAPNSPQQPRSALQATNRLSAINILRSPVSLSVRPTTPEYDSDEEPAWSRRWRNFDDDYNDVKLYTIDDTKRCPDRVAFKLVQKTLDDNMGIHFEETTEPVPHIRIVVERHSQAAAVGMVTGMRICGVKSKEKGPWKEIEMDSRPFFRDCSKQYPRLVFLEANLAILKHRKETLRLSAYIGRRQRVLPIRNEIKAKLGADADPIEVTLKVNQACLEKMKTIRHDRRRQDTTCDLNVVRGADAERAETLSDAIANKSLPSDKLREAERELKEKFVDPGRCSKRRRKHDLDKEALRNIRS
ncbi:hypothetical protein AC1031_006392 [Aphanomyces cochlioides]|nr:hypothetical protein AC1031_006392 [Aphanomyces cochlioides]